MIIDSNYSPPYVYESSYSSQYELVSYHFFDGLDVYSYLIFDNDSKKFNMYYVIGSIMEMPHFLEFVVDNCRCLPYEYTMYFPEYGILLEEYGF